MPFDLDIISEFFRDGLFLITKHGYQELDHDHITIENLRHAIGADETEIIENYPGEPQGESCLIIGWCSPDFPIHVCLGMSSSKPEIITVYQPKSTKFYPPEYRKRRK
jgi:hypothetical protein